MKRTLFAMLMALSLLLTACGSTPAASQSGTASQPAESTQPSAGTESEDGVDLNAIPEFEVPDYSIGLLDSGFYEGVTALEHVKLPKLEGMVVPAALQTVSDDAVQAEIDALMADYAYIEQIKDRPVENGDLVNIDYVGRIDGVAFSGGNTNGMGTTVTAGSTAYIDDFLTQIIGAKPGDTVMVEVTFPTPYAGNPDLSGKDAVFETVINYIEGDLVQPELTDAFVKENLQESYGYTSAEDMREEIRWRLRQDQLTNHVLTTLYEQCTFTNVPDKLVQDQCDFMLMEVKNVGYYNNMTLGQVLAYYGHTSMEELYAQYRPSFQEYAEQYLMCQAVAEQLNFVIDDAAIQNYFTNVVGGSKPDAYISYYGRGYVAQDVLMDMVTSYLIDNAVYQ